VPLVLDPDTGCLPSTPQLHDAAREDIEVTFVRGFPASATRRPVWGAYGRHTSLWKLLVGADQREQWLDGSFTTNKENPGDLDFATFVPLEAVNSLTVDQRVEFSGLFPNPFEAKWGGWLHAILVPVGEAGTDEAKAELVQREALLRLFGRARPGDGGYAKGVLRLWT